MNSILNIGRPIHSNQVTDGAPEVSDQAVSDILAKTAEACDGLQSVRQRTEEVTSSLSNLNAGYASGSGPRDDERLDVDLVSTVPSSVRATSIAAADMRAVQSVRQRTEEITSLLLNLNAGHASGSGPRDDEWVNVPSGSNVLSNEDSQSVPQSDGESDEYQFDLFSDSSCGNSELSEVVDSITEASVNDSSQMSDAQSTIVKRVNIENPPSLEGPDDGSDSAQPTTVNQGADLSSVHGGELLNPGTVALNGRANGTVPRQLTRRLRGQQPANNHRTAFLEREVALIRRTAQSKLQEIEANQNTMAERVRQLESYRNRFEDANTTIEELRSQIGSLSSQIAELNSQILSSEQASSRDRQEQANQISQRDNTIGEMRTNVSELEKKVLELSAERDELKSKNTRLQAVMNDPQAVIASSLQNINQLLSTGSKDQSQLAGELKILTDKLNDLNQKLQLKEEEVKQLRAPTFFNVMSATGRWANKFNPFARR